MVRIIGFLLGFSVASAFAAYQLLDEYKHASALLQASVLDLQLSTENVSIIMIESSNSYYLEIFLKVTAHVRRIEAIEKDLKLIQENSADKDGFL